MNYSYRYTDGSDLQEGDLLRVGGKKAIIITYQYKYDVSDFIDFSAKKVNLSLKYIQPNVYDENIWIYEFVDDFQTFTAFKTGNYRVE